MGFGSNNIPSLRFPEFEGEWEEIRLGEMCLNFKSGTTITSQNIFDEGDFPVYGGNGLRGFTDVFTHDGFYFLIGRQGALCGNINRVSGKSFISEHAIAVNANENGDTEWLAQRLGFINLNRLSESSAQPGLAVNKLIRLKLKVPAKEEQQKIADFLSAVDKKIQVLTRKKELLEDYKKGVMQKIFSRKIRFKDENGNDFPEWEEKRLGEIAKFLKGKNLSKSDITLEGKSECIRYGELYTLYCEIINKVKSRTNLSPSESVLSEINDVLIPASGETHIDIATASAAPYSGIIIGGDINIIRTQHNGVFIAYFLKNAKKIDIARLAQGNSVVHLYSSQLASLKIKLPSFEEQGTIANFLSSLDQKIQSTQSQISLTQEFKKGLLQQMFV